MVKLFNAYFPVRTVLLALTEACLITLALVGSIYARFGADSSLVLMYESGFFKIGIVAAVCLICMYYYDLYDSMLLTNPREVITRLIQVLGTTSLVLAVLYYLYPAVQLSLGVFLTGIAFVGILILLWRRLFFVLSHVTGFAERVLLVGDGSLVGALASLVEKKPELGVRLVGYVANPPTAAGTNGLLRLGRLTDLNQVVYKESITRILVTMTDRRGKLPVDDLLNLKTRGVQVEDGSDFYEMITGKVPLDSLRPSWLLFSQGFRLSKGSLFFKRTFSIVLGSMALLVLLPVMAVIALAIWLDSGGPVLFRQKRVGKDGRIFTLFKFRSMKNGEDFKPAEEDDERLTRVGRWIRRCRVDELPQLYNILRGDMHFVGPRPFALEEEHELAEKIPFYRQRWAVRPGATGWAQIQRGYCATLEDNVDKLAYDLFYIKNMSVGLDLLVILQTLKILLLGRGAR
jgi:sugar transferase (PEP-CTERM system associated)